MKKIILYFMLILVGALVSCSKNDNQQSGLEDVTVTSLDDTEISCTGGDFTLAFTANSSWSIQNCPEWLEISKKQGSAGTTTIKFAAKINETRKSRTASLSFNATDNSFRKEFNILQEYPYLRIDRDSLSFKWNRGKTEREEVDMDTNTEIINISSNIDWKIDTLDSSTKAAGINLRYFALSTLGGYGDTAVEFIPMRDNFEKKPYDTHVRLYPVMKDEKGNIIEISSRAADSYIIKLHQQNLRFLINDSTNDVKIDLSELNDDPNINLSVDCEIPWSVKSKPEWVKFTTSKSNDISIVNIQADGATPTRDARSGDIILTTKAGAERKIAVNQKGYIFTVDTTPVTIGNDDLSEYKFYITTTGTWAIKNIPTWLNVSPNICTKTTPQTGVQNHEITVKANGQNLNFNDLVQTLSISSTMNTLSENKEYTQNKFIFDLTSDNHLSDLPTMNTTKYDASLNSSGKWEVLGIPEWIDVSQTSSQSKGLFNIKIGAKNGNPDISQDRSATLTFVSLNHKESGENVVREVKVKQRKYTFEVEPLKDLNIAAYRKNLTNYFSTLVKCSAEWTLQSCPTWIKPSIEGGDGSVDLTINYTPEANIVKEKRNGAITIKSLYNGEVKTFQVSQDAFVFNNESVSNDVVVMNEKKYPISFDLTAEVDWQLKSGYASWLKPNITSGTGTSTITFTPEPNPLLQERQGKAFVINSVTNEEKELTFTQEKYEFDGTSENYSYTELDKTSNPISILCSGPWTIPDAPTWMNISSKAGSTSSSITIQPMKNVQTTPRNATFNIVSTLNQLKKSITVQQDAYKFDSTSNSFSYETLEEREDSFTVLSSGSWQAKNVPNWITLSQMSGTGSEAGTTETIKITSTKNLTESDRKTTISIVSDDNASLKKDITLFQTKFDFRVDQTTLAYTNPLDVSSKDFNITCPAAWTVGVDKDWIALSSKEGSGNGNIVITPKQNLTIEDRSAKVTVTSTLNALKREIIVSQPKFIFEVSKSEYTFPEPLVSKSSPTNINVKCSDKWEVSTDVSWLTISPTSGTGDLPFTISVNNDNVYTSSRSAKVVVKSILNGLTKEINISQNPYIFDSTIANVEFDACQAQSKQVAISCSGKWKFETSATWLSAEQSVTSGNGNLIITVQDNPTEEDRNTTITVTSLDNTTLTKSINIVQKKHSMEVTPSQLTFEAVPSAPQNISVETFGQWKLSSDQEWCVVSQETFSGTRSASISCNPNPVKSERTAKVTISCTTTPISRIVTITQKAFVFNIGSTEKQLTDPSSTESFSTTVNCSGTWSAQSDSQWLLISKNGSTLTMTPQANPTYSTRQAIVSISNNVNSEILTFVVTQAAFVFNIDSTEKLLSDPTSTTPFSATISCFGKWTAQSDSQWLSVSQNGATLTMTPQANPTYNERKAIVTISNNVNSDVLKFEVRQAAFVFNIESTGKQLTDPTSTESFSTTVNCSGTWSAKSDSQWLSVSQNGATLTMTPQANPTYSTRQAIVSISNNISSEVLHFEVTQAAFVFNTSSDSRDLTAESTQPFSITVNCSGTWSAQSDSQWLSVSQSGSTLTMTPQANTTSQQRTANITIKNNINSDTKTFVVKQAGKQNNQ